jgi:hypothetical protein
MATDDNDDTADTDALTSPAPAPAPPEPAPAGQGDQTVKQLLDTKTRADLERWFGLPSFQELAEKGEPPPADPELEATRERRAKAMAAVDPALLERHRQRVESGEGLIRFQAVIDVRVDPSLTQIDLDLIEQRAVAEPREVEIPDQLREDLAECTPQAILRDLHRPETYFDKLFEIVDMAAEQRLDIVAAVDEAMRTSWKLPPLEGSPLIEARALMAAARQERLGSVAHLLPLLPNRRVTEP